MGQFRVFCESMPRQIVFLGLVVIPGAARGTRILPFDKNQEHTTFPSTTSNRQRARAKRKNLCKSNGMTRWCEKESPYYVTSISTPRYRYVGVSFFFLNPVFNHFLEDFFKTNRNRLVGVPRDYFRQKLKSTNSPNFDRKQFTLLTVAQTQSQLD